MGQTKHTSFFRQSSRCAPCLRTLCLELRMVTSSFICTATGVSSSQNSQSRTRACIIDRRAAFSSASCVTPRGNDDSRSMRCRGSRSIHRAQVLRRISLISRVRNRVKLISPR